MARNSRENELRINGITIQESLIKPVWTQIAKECYANGCKCSSCSLFPELESITKCKVKYYVIAYIKKGYYPNNKRRRYTSKWK